MYLYFQMTVSFVFFSVARINLSCYVNIYKQWEIFTINSVVKTNAVSYICWFFFLFVNIYKLIKLKCNDTRTKIRRIFFLTFWFRKFSKCPNKKYFTHLSLFLCNRWNDLTKTWYSPKNYFSGFSRTSVSPFYETSTWVITR